MAQNADGRNSPGNWYRSPSSMFKYRSNPSRGDAAQVSCGWKVLNFNEASGPLAKVN